ncbi:methyltransferase family protein [Sungkyunkwania multivorans]|uniref:Methyltransferase family protein n=1 Tax=Sungkyunkwania multivorans TaxID=1173618 RepID=A0ABW3D281_9FLAO
MSKTSFALVTLEFFSGLFLTFYTATVAPSFWALFQCLAIALAVWGVLSLGIKNLQSQPEVKSDMLIKKGPYRLLRNPIYLGLLLFFLPLVWHDGRIIVTLVYTLLAGIIFYKIVLEEVYLEERFGEEYLAYKKDTYSLIPFIF